MDRPRREPIVGKWWVFRLSLLMRFVFLGDGKKVARAIPPSKLLVGGTIETISKAELPPKPPQLLLWSNTRGPSEQFLTETDGYAKSVRSRRVILLASYVTVKSDGNRLLCFYSAPCKNCVWYQPYMYTTFVKRAIRREKKRLLLFDTQKKNDRGRVCGQPRCSSHDVVVLGEEPLTDWVRPALHFWREEWGRTATILRVRVSPRSRQSFRSAQKGWRNVIASVAVALCTLTDTL